MLRPVFTSSFGAQHVNVHIGNHNGPSIATSIDTTMYGMSPQLCLVCACRVDRLVFCDGAQAAD